MPRPIVQWRCVLPQTGGSQKVVKSSGVSRASFTEQPALAKRRTWVFWCEGRDIWVYLIATLVCQLAYGGGIVGVPLGTSGTPVALYLVCH
jgi:hypothetical protein